MDAITQLFKGHKSKQVWKSTLTQLTSWPFDDSAGYIYARQFAKDLLTVYLAKLDPFGPRPTPKQLKEITSKLKKTISNTILWTNFGTSLADSCSYLKWHGHSKWKLEVPLTVHSIKDFYDWFGYELPFGGKLDEWYLMNKSTGQDMITFSPGTTIIARSSADYRHEVARTLLPMAGSSIAWLIFALLARLLVRAEIPLETGSGDVRSLIVVAMFVLLHRSSFTHLSSAYCREAFFLLPMLLFVASLLILIGFFSYFFATILAMPIILIVLLVNLMLYLL